MRIFLLPFVVTFGQNLYMILIEALEHARLLAFQ